MSDYPKIEMFIDGVWIGADERENEPVINPANEKTLGLVPHATIDDLDRALKAAERGFPVWRDTPIEQRTRILKKAAALIRERSAEIGRVMTMEQGKPLAEASGEAMRIAGTLDWDTEQARRTYGRSSSSS